ncbi:hypothetical protein, partial [Klebsiella pneumoniae]
VRQRLRCIRRRLLGDRQRAACFYSEFAEVTA